MQKLQQQTKAKAAAAKKTRQSSTKNQQTSKAKPKVSAKNKQSTLPKKALGTSQEGREKESETTHNDATNNSASDKALKNKGSAVEKRPKEGKIPKHNNQEISDVDKNVTVKHTETEIEVKIRGIPDGHGCNK